MKLLNTGNTKTRKGEKLGWITYGMHLAPAHESGFNACPWASKGCSAACLNTAGRGMMSNVQKARINKTQFFFRDKAGFMSQLLDEIEKATRRADRLGMRACFRLNLTSDIPWEAKANSVDGKTVFEHFPEFQFYDYTKGAQRAIKNRLPNYDLTFSRSESNGAQCKLAIKAGLNVAVVFRNGLPKTWQGLPVVDGDETDLRFLDRRNCIVGLVEKGLAKVDSTGFVVG